MKKKSKMDADYKEEQEAYEKDNPDEPAPKAVLAMAVKNPALCVEEGCMEPKEVGQTHVCHKHIRTN